MDQTEQFKQKINEGCTCQGGALVMGSAMLRATVIEFGPVLLSRILELNDTQGGVVSLA